MRTVGLDVHREFAEVAIIEEDGVARAGGQVETTPEALRLFAASLAASDEVAIEATVNTFAIAALLAQHVARVVISNPLRTRAIAEAKVKTDKVDARVLAELLRAGLKGASIGVTSPSGEGWEDRRHDLLLPLSRSSGSAGCAGS